MFQENQICTKRKNLSAAVILVLLCNSIRTKISAITEIISNACQLKTEFFKNLERDGSVIILIDDHPMILHEIEKTSKDVVLLKDTVLVD